MFSSLRPFYLLIAAAWLAPLLHAQQPADPAAPAPKADATGQKPNSSLTSPTEAARQKIADAVKKMNANDADGAMAALTQAIQLKPDSAFAYILRGSVYAQKHQFQQAHDDFDAAAKIDPANVVIKFNLIELKFMQKQYDDARAGFATLQKDVDMGDFASYKVFLCDLFGGHEDAAKGELDEFNKKGEGISYFFANAAWDLYHKDVEGARGWLTSASNIFAARKFTTYGQSLRDLGYLPLPLPKDGSVGTTTPTP